MPYTDHTKTFKTWEKHYFIISVWNEIFISFCWLFYILGDQNRSKMSRWARIAPQMLTQTTECYLELTKAKIGLQFIYPRDVSVLTALLPRRWRQKSKNEWLDKQFIFLNLN